MQFSSDPFDRLEQLAAYLPEAQRSLCARVIYARRGLRMLGSAQAGRDEACRCIAEQHISPETLLCALLSRRGISLSKPPQL